MIVLIWKLIIRPIWFVLIFEFFKLILFINTRPLENKRKEKSLFNPDKSQTPFQHLPNVLKYHQLFLRFNLNPNTAVQYVWTCREKGIWCFLYAISRYHPLANEISPDLQRKGDFFLSWFELPFFRHFFLTEKKTPLR